MPWDTSRKSRTIYICVLTFAEGLARILQCGGERCMCVSAQACCCCVWICNIYIYVKRQICLISMSLKINRNNVYNTNFAMIMTINICSVYKWQYLLLSFINNAHWPLCASVAEWSVYIVLMLCYACWWFAPAWASGCLVANWWKRWRSMHCRQACVYTATRSREVHMYGNTCGVRGRPPIVRLPKNPSA